jgi:hypothetical protein
MDAIKKTTKKNTTKKVNFTEKDIKNYLDYTIKSGVALKSSTVKNKGNYPISSSKVNGTSLVLRNALIELKKDKVSGKELINFLVSLENKTEIEYTKNISIELDKEYKNFRTLRNRLKKEVEKGLIKSFFLEK